MPLSLPDVGANHYANIDDWEEDQSGCHNLQLLLGSNILRYLLLSVLNFQIAPGAPSYRTAYSAETFLCS